MVFSKSNAKELKTRSRIASVPAVSTDGRLGTPAQLARGRARVPVTLTKSRDRQDPAARSGFPPAGRVLIDFQATSRPAARECYCSTFVQLPDAVVADRDARPSASIQRRI
jgi:hypothetical protein